MNFTNSPYEKMMKQKPRPSRPKKQKPPHGSPCRGCTYWLGLCRYLPPGFDYLKEGGNFGPTWPEVTAYGSRQSIAP